MTPIDARNHDPSRLSFNGEAERMQPFKLHPGPAADTRAPSLDLVMNPWETQHVFREMVVMEVRHGKLNRSRRRRIIQFAARLGISPVQAGHLVQQARRLVAHESPRAMRSFKSSPPDLRYVDLDDRPWLERWRFVIAGLLAATTVCIVLIRTILS